MFSVVSVGFILGNDILDVVPLIIFSQFCAIINYLKDVFKSIP